MLSKPSYHVSLRVPVIPFSVDDMIHDLLTWINMQVPAKPNYNLVMYYAAERPVNKDSLLGRFIDGTDAFRDARFKLIPSIVEVCMS